MSIYRLWAIVRKEFRHIRRDKRALFLVTLSPSIMLLTFSYLFALEVQTVRLGVWDLDRSALSRQMLASLTADEKFIVAAPATDYDAIHDEMMRGQIHVGLVIPPDFETKLRAGESSPIQIIADGSDAISTSQSVGRLRQRLQAFVDGLDRLGRSYEPMIVVQGQAWYNRELDSMYSMVPGLIPIALILPSLAIALALTREKELGSFETLITTPIRPLEYLLGKLIPYVGFGLVSAILSFLLAVGWFKVPLRGSPADLVVMTVCYLIASLGETLFLTGFLSSQGTAMRIILVLFFIPSFFLSGATIPVDSNSGPGQFVSFLLPTSYYVDITRGAFLKGMGLASLFRQSLTLLALGVLPFLLSVWTSESESIEMRTILNLAWKELLQLVRDRLLLGFLIVMPVMQLYLIAEATGGGIRNVKLAVWDQDQSQLSQDLTTALDNTNEFELVARAASYAELEDLVQRGQVRVGIIFPPEFSREALRPGVGATLPAFVDATNVIAASNILLAIDGAVRDLMIQNTAAGSGGATPAGLAVTVLSAFNPTQNYRWSTMPAQFAFITYQVVLVIAAVGLVRERELGTMEQLMVTPIHRLQLLLGKGLMALLIGLVNLFLLYLLLTYGFGIPLRGSLPLLFGLGTLFILAEIGVGTLISVLTTSQQQAILLVFLLAILEVTFSGYLVPTENMPLFMQALATVSPLQHFMAITRAIFLKGSTLPMLLNHVIPLFLLTLGSLALSLRLFTRMETQ